MISQHPLETASARHYAKQQAHTPRSYLISSWRRSSRTIAPQEQHESLAVRAPNHSTRKSCLANQSARSYRLLSTRTRLIIGVGIMTYAGFGILVSDKAEQVFGFVPTEQDKQRLQEAIPKVHALDRER